MSTDAVERPLTPNMFARLAHATRYAVTGAAPEPGSGRSSRSRLRRRRR